MAMRGVNTVILLGNVGGDPDVRFFPSGDAVANVSLATSETWKDKKSGETQERTEWHRLQFIGKIAEIVQKYVHKGSKIYVQGKLRTRKWTDKDGIERYTTEVIVDRDGTLQMLEGKNESAQSERNEYGAKKGKPAQRATMSQTQGAVDKYLDDDCSF